MKKILTIIIAVVIILGLGVVWKFIKSPAQPPAPILVTNYEECLPLGDSVMESYPGRCRYGDQMFIEEIGNELEKKDLIFLETPRPGQSISSPLVVRGEARGFWFFEADFPVFLTDWDGRIIAQGIATAEGEWMTEDFVPFEAMLTFIVDENVYSNRGTLILNKDNPSGLPEHDDALEIPILFEKVN